MKPTKLYESLFILFKCNQTINRLGSVINEHQNNIHSIQGIGVILTNHIKLESVSFLDEFNGAFFHNIGDEFKPRMMDVRRITAPIIKRINKWKDLRKFRNNIVAHPWRDEGKFAVPDPQYYDIPRSWFEVAVLVNLMNYVWFLITVEFKKELNEALPYIASLKPPDKEPADHSGLNDDHLNMADEIAVICQQLNKPYYLKVMQYILPGDN